MKKLQVMGALVIFTVLILAVMANAEMSFVKNAAGEDKVEEERTWQGRVPATISGECNIKVTIFTDEELQELLAEKVYPQIQIQNGMYHLPLKASQLDLTTGQEYWMKIEIDTGKEVFTKVQRLLVSQDTRILIEEANAGGSLNAQNPVTLIGSDPNYMAAVWNQSTGYGVYAKSSLGTGLYAQGVSGGNAIETQGNVDITGDLTVSGTTNLTLPADSVGTSQIQDGAIANVDIASDANIDAGKINRTNLDADTLDNKDSTEFAALDAEGILQVPGLSTNNSTRTFDDDVVFNSVIGSLDTRTLALNGNDFSSMWWNGNGIPQFAIDSRSLLNGGNGGATFWAHNGTQFLKYGELHGNGNWIFGLNGGKVGIGIDNPPGWLTVIQRDGEASGIRIQGAGQKAHLHIRPSQGYPGEISFTEDQEADRWVLGTKPGDSNFYFSSGDSFLNAATPRMVINGDNGKVGIGTIYPEAPLTIDSIYAREMIKLFSGPSTQWNLGIRNNNGDAFEIGEGLVNSAHLMIAKSSGNVGIGKNPDYKLDVNGYIQGSALCINGDCRSGWPSLDGGGSSNYIAKFSNSYTLTNSIISDDGNNVGIGISNRPTKLGVYVPENNTAISVFSGSPVGLYHLDITPFTIPNGPSGVIDYKFVAVRESLEGQPGTAITALTIKQNGNVGIGTDDPQAKLEVSGNIRATNIAAHYQDLAEWVPSSQNLEPATVVVIDPENNNQVIASNQAYDPKVAGVVSAQPGFILGQGGEGQYQIAHTGRVKVKVDASYGAIAIGDLLVTSPVGATAMKSEPKMIEGEEFHRPGTILGKALEALSEGQGEILVLLSLQ